MTDAEKREKVIKGLGEALTLLAEYVPCEGYLGYAPGACLDAIELLKAQEPRVMTLEEISRWDGAVLVEYTGTFGNPMFEWLLYQVQHNQYVMFSNHNRSNVTFDANDYGKGWCCWTSRPTDEQREKEPWNEE